MHHCMARALQSPSLPCESLQCWGIRHTHTRMRSSARGTHWPDFACHECLMTARKCGLPYLWV